MRTVKARLQVVTASILMTAHGLKYLWDVSKSHLGSVTVEKGSWFKRVALSRLINNNMWVLGVTCNKAS